MLGETQEVRHDAVDDPICAMMLSRFVSYFIGRAWRRLREGLFREILSATAFTMASQSSIVAAIGFSTLTLLRLLPEGFVPGESGAERSR